MLALYSAHFGDGEADMVDPLAACPVAELGDLDPSDLSALHSLRVGESLRIGGGAAPLVSIVRTY